MALNLAEERLAERRAEEVAARVGHPGERFMTLRELIRTRRVRDFADVTDEFLALMWCLDQYRIAVFAWHESRQGDGYVPVALPGGPSVETLDVALWRIESEISEAIESGAAREPIEPSAPVDADELIPDR